MQPTINSRLESHIKDLYQVVKILKTLIGFDKTITEINTSIAELRDVQKYVEKLERPLKWYRKK